MPNCGASGCTNRSNDHPEKSFHKLPSAKKENLRKAWLAKINRAIIPKELYICSDHFDPDCFERDLRVSLIFFFFFH